MANVFCQHIHHINMLADARTETISLLLALRPMLLVQNVQQDHVVLMPVSIQLIHQADIFVNAVPTTIDKQDVEVHLQLNHAHHIHVVHFHVSMLQIHQVVSFANVHTTITVHKVVEQPQLLA